MKNIKETVNLNGKEVSKKELQEARNKLQKSERIVEVTPGKFKKLHRMTG